MTNYYLKAIHADDRIEQLHAIRKFLEGEMRRVEDRMVDIETDDGTIPDDKAEQWSYEKGKLDSLATVYGMVVQSLIIRGEMVDDVVPDGGGGDT